MLWYTYNVLQASVSESFPVSPIPVGFLVSQCIIQAFTFSFLGLVLSTLHSFCVNFTQPLTIACSCLIGLPLS